MYVDGVVVMGNQGDTLHGFDANTGKELWKLQGKNNALAVPSLWKHQGKSYILSPADKIYSPATNPEVAGKLHYGWNAPYYSNARTHRMQLDEDENIFLRGWSASFTSQEPW